jgi:hypothetical protein
MSGERTQALLRQLWKTASPIFSDITVPSVVASPGWVVVGAFVHGGDIPCKLSSIALVSNPLLVARLRLFGPIGGVAVEIPGSNISTSSATDVLVESGTLALVAGSMYQIQAECTGGDLVTDFAVLRYVNLLVN